jgi:outer membrane lipoprotein-sorting protein
MQAQLLPQPFSADFTGTTKTHAGDFTGKIFFSLPHSRMNMSTKGREMSMIMDSSKQVSYMLMHAQKMYMEFRADQVNPMARNLPQVEHSFNAKNPCASSMNTDSTCKDLGPDIRNGRTCEKWLLTRKSGDTMTMWVDQKLHFPIRTETSAGSVYEYSNIQEGPQPASLFELPAGYRRFDVANMPGGKPPL